MSTFVIMSNLLWSMDLFSRFPCSIVFIVSDFAFTTRHTHSWVSFPLWPNLFILSGAIYLFFPSSILNTFWLGGLIFLCHIFLPFILFMGFSQQEYWSNLPFPPPVDHVMLELSTVIHLSWVALHGIHNLIELCKPLHHDKAVTHKVICNIVQESVTKTIPKRKKFKIKWLSEEALQIAEERRHAKSKGDRERYTQLNAEFQRIARRDKKSYSMNNAKK